MGACMTLEDHWSIDSSRLAMKQMETSDLQPLILFSRSTIHSFVTLRNGLTPKY